MYTSEPLFLIDLHFFTVEIKCCNNHRRGTLALRRLCTLLDAERVYRELATIFEGEADLEFATIMVQVNFLTQFIATDSVVIML